ncbi:MAG TPA: polysaccharide deacetylase family protein [Spirochaetota bacterium]|nr:polysaccharide deacetylase family protein [Spirochaetota bacterium]HOS41402.1 polysaccharide deacetylase family protein [Spirochaetota bacterium]HPI23989.1 polysaccharide deacetylase family protein [Spirochaetota bacterium]HPU89296.1 polysaccharide deacetylase family protein [Spirochaetota bacterium]
MVRLITDIGDGPRRTRCEYAFRTLLDVAGVSPDNALAVSYASEPHTRCDVWIRPEGAPAIARRRRGAIAIDDDIIAESFALLSCAEEYGGRRDGKGRFLARFTERAAIDIPVVNRHALTLKRALARAARAKGKRLRTDPRRFTVVLSHDVDNITDKNIHVCLHRAARAVKYLLRGRIASALRMGLFTLGRLFARGNPYDNYAAYIDLERRYGFRSTFFMITGAGGRFGARYSIAQARSMLGDITAAGWEVGLHTNYYSFHDPKAVIGERRAIEDAIGRPIAGCRNHYLMLSIPESWRVMVRAGLVYDSSVGYTDAIGFRAGVAYPYRPYDMAAEAAFDLIEIPLVIMDTAVLDYDGDREAAWARIQKVLDETRDVGGTIAVNFHHRALYDREFAGWNDIYIRILDYIREHNGRGITASMLVGEVVHHA